MPKEKFCEQETRLVIIPMSKVCGHSNMSNREYEKLTPNGADWDCFLTVTYRTGELIFQDTLASISQVGDGMTDNGTGIYVDPTFQPTIAEAALTAPLYTMMRNNLRYRRIFHLCQWVDDKGKVYDWQVCVVGFSLVTDWRNMPVENMRIVEGRCRDILNSHRKYDEAMYSKAIGHNWVQLSLRGPSYASLTKFLSAPVNNDVYNRTQAVAL